MSGLAPLRRSAGASLLALFAASGTLVCCVLPALMVSLGAGAALAGLVTQVPQLIWLSARKELVFGVATLALVIAGMALLAARRAPCPLDPEFARSCAALRRFSWWTYALAVAATAIGALFAFALG